MSSSSLQFHLASASPRRAELLAQLCYKFTVTPVNICEQRNSDELAEAYVQRLATEKAAAGFQQIAHESAIVLGADTIVCRNAEVLGKPTNQQDAARMLTKLSGNTHVVYTAVSVCTLHSSRTILNKNEVSMRNISTEEIARYWQTGEPNDKAGGYAIQGFAAAFIWHIHGSYSGIMGLPLFETAELLAQYNITSPAFLKDT